MLKKLALAFAAVVLFATSAWAQSQHVSANLSLTLTPFLSCSKTRDIAWGSVARSGGPVFTSAANYAEWSCQTDPGNRVAITFTLPTQLTNTRGSMPIPLTYGASSGFVDANASQFDPHSGLSNDIVTSGTAVIRLGWPRNGTGSDELVQADVTQGSVLAVDNPYSATVTVNVTLN